MPPPLIRTSERRDFKRCPQRWEWGWREGLRATGPPADPLWFGSGMHLALAHWYCGPGLTRGDNPVKVWKDYVGDSVRHIRTEKFEGADYKADEWIEAGTLGEHMLENYINKYGDDKNWFVLEPEQTFQINIPHPSGSRWPLAVFAGTYDLTFRDLADGTIWLGEHKNYKAISTGHLEMDDQVGGYLAVATKNLQHKKQIEKGEKIEGVLYNILRKGRMDERPRDENGMHLNKNGSVSKNQPAPLFHRERVYRTRRQQVNQIRQIQSELQTMNLMRKDKLPVYKNPTRDCSWDCQFYQMCILHDKGNDWQEYKEVMFRTQDPYADHRASKSMEE